MEDYFDRIKDGGCYLHRSALDVYDLTEEQGFWMIIDEHQYAGSGITQLPNRDKIVNHQLNIFDGVHCVHSLKNEYNERRNK